MQLREGNVSFALMNREGKEQARHMMVAIHNPGTFHMKELRRDVSQGCGHAKKYYIDFEVKREKEYKHGEQSCRNYDFDYECVEKRFNKQLTPLTKTNCTVPLAKGSQPVCKNIDDIRVAKSLVDDITHFANDRCIKVCETMQLTYVGSLNANVSRGRVSIKLMFQPFISENLEADLYNWESLGAEIGGYVGIMVGYSILSLSELLISMLKK